MSVCVCASYPAANSQEGRRRTAGGPEIVVQEQRDWTDVAAAEHDAAALPLARSRRGMFVVFHLIANREDRRAVLGQRQTVSVRAEVVAERVELRKHAVALPAVQMIALREDRNCGRRRACEHDEERRASAAMTSLLRNDRLLAWARRSERSSRRDRFRARSAVIVCDDDPASNAPLVKPPDRLFRCCCRAPCAERRADRELRRAGDQRRRMREAVAVHEPDLRPDRDGRDRRRVAARSRRTASATGWLSVRFTSIVMPPLPPDDVGMPPFVHAVTNASASADASRNLLRNDRRPHRSAVVEKTAEEIGSGAIGRDRLRRRSSFERPAAESAGERRAVLHQRRQPNGEPFGKLRRIRNERRRVREAVGVHEVKLRADRDLRYRRRVAAALAVRRASRALSVKLTSTVTPPPLPADVGTPPPVHAASRPSAIVAKEHRIIAARPRCGRATRRRAESIERVDASIVWTSSPCELKM